MIRANKRVGVTELTRDLIVSYARKWYLNTVRVPLLLFAGTGICYGCYHVFRSVEIVGGVLMMAAALFGIFAFICLIVMDVFRTFLFFYKDYKLLRDNIPNGNYSLKRVKLVYKMEKPSGLAEFAPAWYYEDNCNVNQLKTCFTGEVVPSFLDGAGACRITRKFGIVTNSAARLISPDYHYLVFIDQEPCIIFPECFFSLSSEVLMRCEN